MNSKLLQSTSPSNHPILFRVKAVLWGLVEGASTSFVFFWVALVVTYAFMIMVHNSWNPGGSKVWARRERLLAIFLLVERRGIGRHRCSKGA